MSDSSDASKDLKKKLKDKLNQSKLKRSGTDAKRSYLEKAKVPENMMEQCMKAMNHTSGANVVQMMHQLQNMARPTAEVVPEVVAPTEQTASITQREQQAQAQETVKKMEKLVTSMPETAKALADALAGRF
jgi:hypothetical protein